MLRQNINVIRKIILAPTSNNRKKKEVEQETKELLNSDDELQQKAKRAKEKTKEHTEQGFSRTQNLSLI